MNNLELVELKREGHILLDEYIALDYTKGKRLSVSINETYEKLSALLPEGRNPHFSSMTTTREVLDAIAVLRNMIKKRKARIRHKGYDKNKIAPNVIELQQIANNLNPHLKRDPLGSTQQIS